MVSGGTLSARPNATAMRSARRQTVRPMWSSASRRLPPGRAKGGENRAEIEEFVLHAQQDGGQHGEARLFNGELVDGGARGSQETVQLVDRAVGCNARVILGNALAAGESAIAGASVDAVDGEAGLVKGLFSHG